MPKAPPVPKMPCKMQTCEMVCKLVTKKLGESKYAITYQEKVCAFDAKCEAANAKCVPQLIALMKAAEAAEKALEKASAAKAAAKGNHAKATAAKEAALKEQSAAKGALDAAQALVNEATSEAASAKTQYGENSAIYKKRAAAAEQALKTYQAMKKEHLHAQGEFKGKASAEMKAYNEYTAALNKHCGACFPLNPSATVACPLVRSIYPSVDSIDLYRSWCLSEASRCPFDRAPSMKRLPLPLLSPRLAIPSRRPSARPGRSRRKPPRCLARFLSATLSAPRSRPRSTTAHTPSSTAR